MSKKDYTFGEREFEYDKEIGEDIEVWQSPKYKESKDKAIEIIDSKKYGVSEGDFWILKNKTQSGKMGYTGLIISHNGCLKINDNMENKVKPSCFQLDKEGYNGSLVYTYIDEDTYEVGEFSKSNGKNPYPYAMAFKRCFDRVVLKKSKLAYSGIYSEVEADEFKKEQETEVIDEFKEHNNLEMELDKLIEQENVDYDKLVEMYKTDDIHKMSVKQIKHAIGNIDKFEKVQ